MWRYRLLLPLTLGLVNALTLAPAQEEAQCWTAIGSTGVVDDAHSDAVVLGHPGPQVVGGENADRALPGPHLGDAVVSLQANAAQGAYIVRYNVTTTDFIWSGRNERGSLYFKARVFVEDLERHRVVALLKGYSIRDERDEVPPNQETVAVVAAIDTQDPPDLPGSDVPVPSPFSAGRFYTLSRLVPSELNFATNAYFVEVRLYTEPDTFGRPQFDQGQLMGPAVSALQVCSPPTTTIQ